MRDGGRERTERRMRGDSQFKKKEKEGMNEFRMDNE